MIGDLNYNMFEKNPNNHLLEFCNLNGFKNTNTTVGTRLNTNKGQKMGSIRCYLVPKNKITN